MRQVFRIARRCGAVLVQAGLMALPAGACVPRSALVLPPADEVAVQAIAASAPAVVAVPAGEARFAMVPGSTLRTTLEQWAAAGGWTVHWATERSYPIRGRAIFTGDFVAAASDLIRSFRHLNPPPIGRFYLRNKELRVVTPGDEMGE